MSSARAGSKVVVGCDFLLSNWSSSHTLRATSSGSTEYGAAYERVLTTDFFLHRSAVSYLALTMDIVQAVSGYITKMVSAGDSAATGTSAAKMKILLLDNDTVGLSAPPVGCKDNR